MSLCGHIVRRGWYPGPMASSDLVAIEKVVGWFPPPAGALILASSWLKRSWYLQKMVGEVDAQRISRPWTRCNHEIAQRATAHKTGTPPAYRRTHRARQFCWVSLGMALAARRTKASVSWVLSGFGSAQPSLASLSASSFPGISLWPGNYLMNISSLLSNLLECQKDFL